MKIMQRDHNFENKLNFIQQKTKYYYLWHELDTKPLQIERTKTLDYHFKTENWKKFEQVESLQY